MRMMITTSINRSFVYQIAKKIDLQRLLYTDHRLRLAAELYLC